MTSAKNNETTEHWDDATHGTSILTANIPNFSTISNFILATQSVHIFIRVIWVRRLLPSDRDLAM